jgi:hypothetical protein
MHAGQLLDTARFAGGDLLVPETGAGDGFEDGLAAGIRGDVSVADD